jgi:uncharacterized protein (TIGR01777 family)
MTNSSAANDTAAAAQTIALSGSTGLIGRRLADRFREQGHTVRPLVRGTPDRAAGEIEWNAAAGRVDAQALSEVDHVVHLAGENIASGRWNDKQKRAIRDSRVVGTTLLVQALTNCDNKPRSLVCASAVGYYGDRGDEPLTEASAPGKGFLSDVSVEWEEATGPAATAGIRVVNARIGVVLSPDGGALEKMLTPFKAGAGGKLGNGQQYISWISLTDVVAALAWLTTEADLSGPVNLTAPQPVTNAELTETLGHVLGRPTFMSVPATMVKLMFGDMGRDLLLASTRVLPERLEKAGFPFNHPTLEEALRAELDRPA